MRYITKYLVESGQFYHFTLNDPYKTFVDEFSEVFAYVDETDNPFDSIVRMYKHHIEQNYKKGIYAEDLVRDIIYGDDSQLKEFDENIYEQLRKIEKDFMDMNLWSNACNMVMEGVSVIINGDFSNDIKDLAKLDKHDAGFQLKNIDERCIQIQYDTCEETIETFLFHLPENQDITYLDNYADKKVLYEELFLCENNLFEYNVLFEVIEKDPWFIDEVSILFKTLEKIRDVD